METQYHPSVAVAPHHQSYFGAPIYSLHSDQYLATSGEVNFASDFLGESSPTYPDSHPHEDYRFSSSIVHRASEASSYYRPLPGSTTTDGLSATGGLDLPSDNTANTGLLTSLYPAEGLALYSGHEHHHQTAGWNWSQAQQAQAHDSIHGVVAPVPVLPTQPEATFLPIKTKPPVSRSFGHPPDPPLPTPAAMAGLLSSGARSEGQTMYNMTSPAVRAMAAPGVVLPTSADLQENTCREKKHACTMCHKR